jgi:soluble lytic murein transglycosylase-like protein
MRNTVSCILVVCASSLPARAPLAPPPIRLVDSRTIPEIVVDAALEHGIRPDLALAIAWRESNYRPDASNPSGAAGIMGLMPLTAKTFGVTDVFDPEQNIEAGTAFLASLIQQHGERLGLCLYGHRRSSCFDIEVK